MGIKKKETGTVALAPGCILRGHAPASTQFPALPGVLETRSPSSRQSPEQVAAALWKRTGGTSVLQARTHLSRRRGTPRGHSCPSHLAPVPGYCAKTEGRAGHLRSPPAARSRRCPPPGYPGPQRVFPEGHPASSS